MSCHIIRYENLNLQTFDKLAIGNQRLCIVFPLWKLQFKIRIQSVPPPHQFFNLFLISIFSKNFAVLVFIKKYGFDKFFLPCVTEKTSWRLIGFHYLLYPSLCNAVVVCNFWDVISCYCKPQIDAAVKGKFSLKWKWWGWVEGKNIQPLLKNAPTYSRSPGCKDNSWTIFYLGPTQLTSLFDRISTHVCDGSIVASAIHFVTQFKVGKMQQKPIRSCDLQKSSFGITEVKTWTTTRQTDGGDSMQLSSQSEAQGVKKGTGG